MSKEGSNTQGRTRRMGEGSGHTGKLRRGVMDLKSKKGKDGMAHSSHHDHHQGQGGAIHGFGNNFAPGEDYQKGGGGESGGSGLCKED